MKNKVFALLAICVMSSHVCKAEDYGGVIIKNVERLQALQMWGIAMPGERVVITITFLEAPEQDVSIFDQASGVRMNYYNSSNGPNPVKQAVWTSPWNDGLQPVSYAVAGNHLSGGYWALDWFQILVEDNGQSTIGLEIGDDRDYNDAFLVISKEKKAQ